MNEAEKNITELIKAKIKSKEPTAEIILFGSHARGKAKKDSDWDILILLNKSIVDNHLKKEIRDGLYDVELEIGEVISTLVYSTVDWESRHKATPLYQNITREGIYL